MSVLGPIVSRWAVETAVIQTIFAWAENYISEVERETFGGTSVIIPRLPSTQLSLPDDQGNDPGNVTSIYGGSDDDTLDISDTPAIIVQVKPASNDVERFADGSVTAEYDLTVTVAYVGESETLARMYADLWGAAIYQLLTANGDLGIDAWTVPLGLPEGQWLDSDQEDDLIAGSVMTFTVYVDDSFNATAAIPTPLDTDTLTNPTPGSVPPDWPVVQGGAITVVGVPDATELDSSDAITD